MSIKAGHTEDVLRQGVASYVTQKEMLFDQIFEIQESINCLKNYKEDVKNLKKFRPPTKFSESLALLATARANRDNQAKLKKNLLKIQGQELNFLEYVQITRLDWAARDYEKAFKKLE